MKYYKLMALLLGLLFLAGCGAEQSGETEPAQKTVLTDEEKIQAFLTELIDRIKEGDKNVLYESEFSYFTDSVSLSEYMEIPRVLEYKYDTLSGIEVDSIKMMDDSAVVLTRVIYESASGEFTERLYPLMMYRYNDRWVKPYLSNYAKEMEYLERIKAYQEAVSEE